MEPEVDHEFKLEAVRLIKERGVSYAQAWHDLGVHQSQLRSWVKALADDPQHAFPGQGQMKPEQLEIAQLKREVIRLKAERDILKKAAAGVGRLAKTSVRGSKGPCCRAAMYRGSIVSTSPLTSAGWCRVP
jgi:transposase